MRIRNRLAACAIPLIAAGFSQPAAALKDTEAYIYTPNNESVQAPEAYVPDRVLYGADLGTEALRNPGDLFVDQKGQIYIADTGNDRIIVTDSGFRVTEIIGSVRAGGEESPLNRPGGVFLGNDGLLYICDTENKRVLGIDGDRNAVRVITGGDLLAVNENIDFKPEKVAVSNDRNVYVCASDLYQGLLRFDENDRFSGFFAPNEVKVTVGVAVMNFWKNLFSAEQQDELEKALPPPYLNLYMNPRADNLFYTVAANVAAGDEVKCLNPLGVNILRAPRGGKDVSFGDREASFENGEYVYSRLIDIHADENGSFAALDATRSRVFVYDREGSLIAIFGRGGAGKGQFDKVAALEKLGEGYLVLDSARGSVTVFTPTAYVRGVMDALRDYNEGLYVESVDKWEQILRMNSHFSIAYRSIGRALLQQGDSEGAMRMLKKGEDKYFYSLALKEYRKAFARRHIVWILAGGAAVAAGLYLTVKTLKRKLSS